MGKTMRKWKKALPWIVLVCFVFGAAMAIYTYCYEEDVYRAVYSFYALPASYGTEEQTPLEASRMLARDVNAITKTENFQSAVKAQCATDGKSIVNAVGVDGTHVIELEVIGPDAKLITTLANTAGQELMTRTHSELKAQSVTVLDVASEPTVPSGPNRIMKIVVTVLAAFLVCSLLGCLFTRIRNTVHATPDGWRTLTLPAVGAVADCSTSLRKFLKTRQKKKDSGMLLEHVTRLIRESIRSVAVALRAESRDAGVKSFTFTGVTAGEGKNVLAALVASELATQGFRVLLADLESRAPRLGKLLGVHGQADLFDYLSGAATIGEIVVTTSVEGLYLIDNKHTGTPLSTIAATDDFVGFVTEASQNFDFVFLNAAPTSICADAAMIGSVTDTTVLVAADGRYTAEEINEAADSLARVVRRLSGIVMTGVAAKNMRPVAGIYDEKQSPLEVC